MKLKDQLSNYTEQGFLELLIYLFEGRIPSEEESDKIVEHIVFVSGHPSETDIIYYPEPGVEDSPQGVLKTIKEWRAKNGKPGFKVN